MNSEAEWIYEYLFQFLKSPGWKVPILDFIDEHCADFEDSEENKLIYTEIHEKFKTLIDNMLDSICLNMGISYEDFFIVCASGVQNKAHHKTFEQILACNNFLSFKRLMIKRNQQLEREALRSLPKLMRKIKQEEADEKKEENMVEKAIQQSIEDAKKIEKIKSIEEKELERAIRLSEEEFRREQDLRNRKNRTEDDRIRKELKNKEKVTEYEKNFLVMAQKKSEGKKNCEVKINYTAKKMSLSDEKEIEFRKNISLERKEMEKIKQEKIRAEEIRIKNERLREEREKEDEKRKIEEINRLEKINQEKFKIEEEKLRMEKINQENKKNQVKTDKDDGQYAVEKTENLGEKLKGVNLDGEEDEKIVLTGLASLTSENNEAGKIRKDKIIENPIKPLEDKIKTLKNIEKEKINEKNEIFTELSSIKTEKLVHDEKLNVNMHKTEVINEKEMLNKELASNEKNMKKIKDDEMIENNEKSEEEKKVIEFRNAEKKSDEKLTREISNTSHENEEQLLNIAEKIDSKQKYLPKNANINENSEKIQFLESKISTIPNVLNHSNPIDTNKTKNQKIPQEDDFSDLIPNIPKPIEKVINPHINRSLPKQEHKVQKDLGEISKKPLVSNEKSVSLSENIILNSIKNAPNTENFKTSLEKQSLSNLKTKENLSNPINPEVSATLKSIGPLNPLEIEDFESASNAQSQKIPITLNPLKEKAKVSIDPSLLRKKQEENPIKSQAPSFLPPLIEESIIIEELGETLAERQARLKQQREFIVNQKKIERRKAIEKYLAEGGPDLTSKNQPVLSQKEIERRKNIISKLKAFKEDN